jgi:hypothetical protein
MPIKVLDQIAGAAPRYSSVFNIDERTKPAAPTVPPAIVKLLARHGITLPPSMGSARRFDVAEIDAHFSRRGNTTLSDRMLCKDALARLGLLL